jgi:hypothetical protein
MTHYLTALKRNRSAPDVYDRPTFDHMAERIFELEMSND